MKKGVTCTLRTRIANFITLITQTAYYASRTRWFCDISPPTEFVYQDMSLIYNSLANYLSYSPTQETHSFAYDVNRKKAATCTYFHLQEALGVLQMASPVTRPRHLHTFSYGQRLRWSRGSVLAFGTQVRRFKPGRSRRIFKGK